jgi:hypothetical protein
MRLLKLALALVAAGWAFAWWQTGQLPELAQIEPELLAEPVQGPTERVNFAFEYRGLGYEVKPVASYDLYGLVVSHNDIHGISDMYHDDDSVDTKDLCVIWGDNLRREDFRRASYSSSAWSCQVSWPAGVEFDLKAMSNNHLVTYRDDLRAVLQGVHPGDQVHFSGVLANYRDLRHPEFWRISSTRRTDEGPGACEVVFFDSLEVLQPHAPLAWRLRRGLPWLFAVLLLATAAVAIATPARFDG